MCYTITIYTVRKNSPFDTTCLSLPFCIALSTCPLNFATNIWISIIFYIDIVPEVTTARIFLIEGKTNHVLLRTNVFTIRLPSFLHRIYSLMVSIVKPSLFTLSTINLHKQQINIWCTALKQWVLISHV